MDYQWYFYFSIELYAEIMVENVCGMISVVVKQPFQLKLNDYSFINTIQIK